MNKFLEQALFGLSVAICLLMASMAEAGISGTVSEDPPKPEGMSADDQKRIRWLMDYIMMSCSLPKDEAISSLNRTQEIFSNFNGKSKTEFGVFLLNQKELKELLTDKTIRDVLFMWSIEILKERPLSENNSQKLLIYWALATKQYADGIEYEERLHALLTALGDALPSVPAMVDWYEALEVIVNEKRAGADRALKKYLYVIDDNWILNMVITQNANNLLPTAWCNALDQDHIFPMTALEMIYLSAECWKASTTISKNALFKTPEGEEIKDPLDPLSNRAEHPLFYMRDAHKKYRLLLLRSVVKNVLTLNANTARLSQEDEILIKQLSIGLSEAPVDSTMNDLHLLDAARELMAGYRSDLTQNDEVSQAELKRKLALLWFVRFSPYLSQEGWTDDEKRFIEEVLIYDHGQDSHRDDDAKLNPLLALSFKQILSVDQWSQIKYQVYTELLSATIFENIYFRMAVAKNMAQKLSTATASSEDHLEAFLLEIYLRRAFLKDTKESLYPLMVTHEQNPVPTIFFEHYGDIRSLQASIELDLMSEGLVTLPQDLMRVVAPEMILYTKAKLAEDGKLTLSDEEIKRLQEQLFLFKDDVSPNPEQSKHLSDSYIPHIYSALFSVGRMTEDESLICDFKKIIPPLLDLYKDEDSISPEQFDEGSKTFVATLESMKEEDFKKKHLKDYFMQWLPVHMKKGDLESQDRLIQGLISLSHADQSEGSLLDPAKSLMGHRLDYIIHMLSVLPEQDGPNYKYFIQAVNLFSKHLEDLESHDMRQALVNLYGVLIDGFDLQERGKIFIGDVDHARHAFFQLFNIAYFMNPMTLEDISEEQKVDLAAKTQWWLKTYLTSYAPETGPSMGTLNGISFSCHNDFKSENDSDPSVSIPFDYRDKDFVTCMMVSRFIHRVFGEFTYRSTDELEILLAKSFSQSHSGTVSQSHPEEPRSGDEGSTEEVLFQGFIEFVKSGKLLSVYQGLENLTKIIGLDAKDIPLYFVIQKIHDHEPQIENLPEYNEGEYMAQLSRERWINEHHKERGK